MFLDEEQLKKILKWFERKIESLERDAYRAFTDKIKIEHNLGKGTAPFPIVLFSMSTLDFFSAAYYGYSEKKNTKSRVSQTKRMIEFLKRYLNYDPTVSKVAIDVFRHKLVHLAEPFCSNKGVIGWSISSRESDDRHWTIKDFNRKGDKAVYFGVDNFIRHLRSGVLGNTGYYQDLSQNIDLQNKYLLFFNEVNSQS